MRSKCGIGPVRTGRIGARASRLQRFRTTGGNPGTYVGQKLLFHGDVDREAVTITWKDLAKRVVGCFAAVEVRSERRDKNRLILEIDHIGRPVGFQCYGRLFERTSEVDTDDLDIPNAVAPKNFKLRWGWRC